MLTLTKQQSSTSVRDQVAPEEWEQRVALAAAYRLVAHFRWDDLIFTHLSARVPGPEHHFLINPYGMTFDEITASNLVKVDLDGRKVMDSPYEINPAGFYHSQRHPRRARGRKMRAPCAQHERRRGVGAEGRSCCRSRSNPSSCCRRWPIMITKAWRCAKTRSRGWCETSATKNFFMLRNHGLITVADNVPDAFLLLYTFEAACMIQSARASRRRRARFRRSTDHRDRPAAGRDRDAGAGGALAWPALLRKLDRIDPSYRS